LLKRLRLGLRLRRIDVIAPAKRAGQGPRGEQFALGGGSTSPAIEAVSAPLFSPANQSSPQRVSFDVANYRVKTVVFLSGKRLELSLVDVALASCMTKGMPALRVGKRQATDETGQLAVEGRPDD